MAAIRHRDTNPELEVRRTLHASGLRYRLHVKDLPGRPDIVLPRHRAVVFVHGCFWHHHGCANSVWPKTRWLFWSQKIRGNVARDRKHAAALKDLGWRVFVVWECEVRRKVPLTPLIRRIRARRSPIVRKLIDAETRSVTSAPAAPGLYEIHTRSGVALKVGISGNLRSRLIQHLNSLQSRLRLKDGGNWGTPSHVRAKQSILTKHLYFDRTLCKDYDLTTEQGRRGFLVNECIVTYVVTPTREAARQIEKEREREGDFRYTGRVRVR